MGRRATHPERTVTLWTWSRALFFAALASGIIARAGTRRSDRIVLRLTLVADLRSNSAWVLRFASRSG